MFKKAFVMTLALALALSVALAACGNQNDNQTEEEQGNQEDDIQVEQERLLIYTSLYPLYYFAKEIAGDRAEVINLIPAGAEPHDYEPTARDIIALSKADLFIYNGGGFETWIEKIVESVNSDTMVLVDSTESIELLTNEETGHNDDHGQEHGKEEEEHNHDYDHGHEHGKEEDHDHDHDHDHEHGKEEDDDHDHHHHDHGEFDPHLWIDPVLAKQQAEAIKNALVRIDSENANIYEENYAQLANRFDELHAQFMDLSKNIERRDFIVSHSAFGYLAHRYNLRQIAITGLNPMNEPSAQQLRDIIKFANENEVEYILFENLVTPKVAEVVKEEVGAEALIIHNLEGLTEEELSQGKDYFSIMHENLEVLKKALGYE